MTVGELGSALDYDCEHPTGLVPQEWPVRRNSRHHNRYLSYPREIGLVHEKGR